MIEVLAQIWLFFEPFHEFFYAVAVTIAASLLMWIFRARVKLIWGTTSFNYHKFELANGNEVSVSTEKYYVQNLGSKAAYNIEIVLSDKPSSYTLWRPRDHTDKVLSNGEFAILIPSLAPKDLLIVDSIDIDLRGPRILAVNCPDAVTKQVTFNPTRTFGKLTNAFFAYVAIAGIVGSIYSILLLIAGFL